MPNVCVRHLGLLGSSESSRLSLSPSSKCDASHLANYPSPLRLLRCTTCALLLSGISQSRPARLHTLPKSGYAPFERYIKTKIFKTDALAQWTKDGWDFQPYGLNEGRVRAPKRYVNQRIKWRAIPNNAIPPEETVGYYAETSTSQRFHPIVFNREWCCWVELWWVTREDNTFWIAQQPAGDDLLCNIRIQDRRPVDKQGPEDDEDPEVVEARREALATAA